MLCISIHLRTFISVSEGGNEGGKGSSMGGAHGTLADRFWSKVEKSEDGCWTWRGAIGYAGYGVLRRHYKIVLAHRVAYELTYGDPGSLDVLHRCDKPLCVRPEHLFIGTHADNMHDMAKKGRHRPKMRVLTPQERQDICQRYLVGGITQEQLAIEYNIAPQSVNRLIREHRKRPA
jgi:DNA-binding CsgD family transcriptional regulator